eukprot:sb/3470041/
MRREISRSLKEVRRRTKNVVSPIYPIGMWDMFQTVLDGCPGTNNHSEENNNALNRFIGCSNPSGGLLAEALTQFNEQAELHNSHRTLPDWKRSCGEEEERTTDPSVGAPTYILGSNSTYRTHLDEVQLLTKDEICSCHPRSGNWTHYGLKLYIYPLVFFFLPQSKPTGTSDYSHSSTGDQPNRQSSYCQPPMDSPSPQDCQLLQTPTCWHLHQT